LIAHLLAITAFDFKSRDSVYCRRQGYEVLERFHEEGESAKSTDRSQLQNLLTYCRLNKGRVHFVVVFNLTRFARDKYDHFALRSHLQSL
jgi:DNA invertase Pin-like site-specific DNA recombinase